MHRKAPREIRRLIIGRLRSLWLHLFPPNFLRCCLPYPFPLDHSAEYEKQQKERAWNHERIKQTKTPKIGKQPAAFFRRSASPSLSFLIIFSSDQAYKIVQDIELYR